MEIYNEDVRDLLGKDQTQRLEVKERPDVGVYVKDLSAFVVNNADDMDRIMTLGNKNSRLPLCGPCISKQLVTEINNTAVYECIV